MAEDIKLLHEEEVSNESCTNPRATRQYNMVMGPDATQNQEWLCWRGPAAIYPTDRPRWVICEIWGSHSAHHEHYCGRDAMNSSCGLFNDVASIIDSIATDVVMIGESWIRRDRDVSEVHSRHLHEEPGRNHDKT
jgi:hypothetical protein